MARRGWSLSTKISTSCDTYSARTSRFWCKGIQAPKHSPLNSYRNSTLARSRENWIWVMLPFRAIPCWNSFWMRAIRQKRKHAAMSDTGTATVSISNIPNSVFLRRSGKTRPNIQLPGIAMTQNSAGQSISKIFLIRGFFTGVCESRESNISQLLSPKG